MRERRKYFRIEMFKRTSSKGKDDHIRGLIPYASSGQIFLHRANNANIIQQIKEFGTGKPNHALDALAQGPHYWRAASGIEQEEKAIAARNKMISARDKITGYSSIR
jgi:hypothetical protein